MCACSSLACDVPDRAPPPPILLLCASASLRLPVQTEKFWNTNEVFLFREAPSGRPMIPGTLPSSAVNASGSGADEGQAGAGGEASVSSRGSSPGSRAAGAGAGDGDGDHDGDGDGDGDGVAPAGAGRGSGFVPGVARQGRLDVALPARKDSADSDVGGKDVPPEGAVSPTRSRFNFAKLRTNSNTSVTESPV
jgi:hypothetical protein